MLPDCKILQGDALTVLKTLPAESVHCCVTSPPYWGLRDYRVAGQLGLERTPEEYVAKMVEVFREVRRVLRGDGTLWCNMGDLYASQGGPIKEGGGINDILGGKPETQDYKRSRKAPFGLKPKDLVGIPWRLAFALQSDGWWLRSDIIWHKPNPMPESVTDRPTKSHEYLFLLSKSERYFYDAEAIKETAYCAGDNSERVNAGRTEQETDPAHFATRPVGRTCGYPNMRNRRTVWTVPTAPYSEAHFATYPPDLIKPCILAGTSVRGCCPKCGAGWERVVEDVPEYAAFKQAERERKGGGMRSSNLETNGLSRGTSNKSVSAQSKTTGWRPTCYCGLAETVPCTVCDPFFGSGTTGLVALELGRKCIGIELNPAYIALAEQRCRVTPGLPL